MESTEHGSAEKGIKFQNLTTNRACFPSFSCSLAQEWVKPFIFLFI